MSKEMFNIHELILLKKWYHAIEDLNIHFIKDYDKALYNKILKYVNYYRRNKMSEGLVCCSCDEWFEVIYNTGSKFSYCPMCGHEYTEEELDKMCKDAEEE